MTLTLTIRYSTGKVGFALSLTSIPYLFLYRKKTSGTYRVPSLGLTRIVVGSTLASIMSASTMPIACSLTW